jgi:hypothetical protein
MESDHVSTEGVPWRRGRHEVGVRTADGKESLSKTPFSVKISKRLLCARWDCRECEDSRVDRCTRALEYLGAEYLYLIVIGGGALASACRASWGGN